MIMDNFSSSSFDDICRLCMRTTDLAPFIQLNLMKTLFNITSIEINANDDLPKNICKNCFDTLSQTESFIETCKRNDQLLRTIVMQEIQDRIFSLRNDSVSKENSNSGEKEDKDANDKDPLCLNVKEDKTTDNVVEEMVIKEEDLLEPSDYFEATENELLEEFTPGEDPVKSESISTGCSSRKLNIKKEAIIKISSPTVPPESKEVPQEIKCSALITKDEIVTNLSHSQTKCEFNILENFELLSSGQLTPTLSETFKHELSESDAASTSSDVQSRQEVSLEEHSPPAKHSVSSDANSVNITSQNKQSFSSTEQPSKSTCSSTYQTNSIEEALDPDLQLRPVRQMNYGKHKSRKKVQKRSICYFCRKDVLHFGRHIERHHISEMEVARIFSFKIGSKIRRELLSDLRKKGNYLKNSAICRKLVRDSKTLEFAPCKYCLGFYTISYLARHVAKCKHNKNKSSTSYSSITDGHDLILQDQDFKVDKQLLVMVFPRMLPDKISLVAKTDRLICMFGAHYLKNYPKVKWHIDICKRKMRELSRLLISLSEELPSIKSMFHALQPRHFDLIMQCLNSLKPGKGFVTSVHASLKKCCDIAMFNSNEAGASDFIEFKQLLKNFRRSEALKNLDLLVEDICPRDLQVSSEGFTLEKTVDLPKEDPLVEINCLKEMQNRSLICVLERLPEIPRRELLTEPNNPRDLKSSFEVCAPLKLPEVPIKDTFIEPNCTVELPMNSNSPELLKLPEVPNKDLLIEPAYSKKLETNSEVRVDPLASEVASKRVMILWPENQNKVIETSLSGAANEDPLVEPINPNEIQSNPTVCVDPPTIKNVVQIPMKKNLKRILIKWTKEQKEVTKTFFANHIRNKKPPKRGEVEILKAQTGNLLSNKTWTQVKVFIQNVYTNKAKY